MPYFQCDFTLFLNELLAYGNYNSELYDSAAAYLIKGLENAPDQSAKTRWYYLIAQLWDKANNYKQAYYWYKKANTEAIQPLISIYAKINMILIDSKQTNTPWHTLTASLNKCPKERL
jgi:tetratricopeptide (TPR) repeat protein